MSDDPFQEGGFTREAVIEAVKLGEGRFTKREIARALSLKGDQRAALAIAGGDQAAKETVFKLARDIGFDPYDAGPLAAARTTERLAWHWIEISTIYGDRSDFAFALLRR